MGYIAKLWVSGASTPWVGTVSTPKIIRLIIVEIMGTKFFYRTGGPTPWSNYGQKFLPL